jgi:peptide/nickel transport system ATP-binding protein
VRDELEVIPGTVPSLVNPPTGCRFASRCSRRFEKCDQPVPLFELEAGRKVRCWLYDGAPIDVQGSPKPTSA